jgi:hypothetical protein
MGPTDLEQSIQLRQLYKRNGNGIFNYFRRREAIKTVQGNTRILLLVMLTMMVVLQVQSAAIFGNEVESISDLTKPKSSDSGRGRPLRGRHDTEQ